MLLRMCVFDFCLLHPSDMRRILISYRTNFSNLNGAIISSPGELFGLLRSLGCVRRLRESFHPMTG
jgi:hypothetical protein